MNTQTIANSLCKYDAALSNYYAEIIQQIQSTDDPEELEKLMQEFQQEQVDPQGFITLANFEMLTDNIIQYCHDTSVQQDQPHSTTHFDVGNNIIQLANVSASTAMFLPKIESGEDPIIGRMILESEMESKQTVLTSEPVKALFLDDMLEQDKHQIHTYATRFANSYNIFNNYIDYNTANRLTSEFKQNKVISNLEDIMGLPVKELYNNKFAMEVYGQAFKLAHLQENGIKCAVKNNPIYDARLKPSPLSFVACNIGAFKYLIEHQGGYTEELIRKNNLYEEFDEELRNKQLFNDVMSMQEEIDEFCRKKNLITGINPPDLFSQFHQNFKVGQGNLDNINTKGRFILCNCMRIFFAPNVTRCDIVNDHRNHAITQYIGANLHYYE